MEKEVTITKRCPGLPDGWTAPGNDPGGVSEICAEIFDRKISKIIFRLKEYKLQIHKIKKIYGGVILLMY